MKEGEPEKEGKLQIEGDRLPLLGGGERERETAVAVENICSIERQIKSFNSLTKLVRSFIRCPRRTHACARGPSSLSLPLISTNSLQSSRKSLPRQLKPLPRRGSPAAAAAAAADQQLLLLPRPAAPLEKSPKAEKNRCAIKVLFDSGQAPLLLELVSYDTVKTLRGVLKYEVRMRSLLGRAFAFWPLSFVVRFWSGRDLFHTALPLLES